MHPLIRNQHQPPAQPLSNPELQENENASRVLRQIEPSSTNDNTGIEAQQLAAFARSNPDLFYGRTGLSHHFNDAQYPLPGPQLPPVPPAQSAPGPPAGPIHFPNGPAAPLGPNNFTLAPGAILPSQPPIPGIPTSANEAQKIWTNEKNRSSLIKQFVRFILNNQPDEAMLARAQMMTAEDQRRMALVMSNLKASGFMKMDQGGQ